MTNAHDLWRTLRTNLTRRDLFPKRRYSLWTDPVTGLPCRSAPAPANKDAAPRRQAKVIRQSKSEQESLQARLLVRAQVRGALTETQYRRVAYLFGFDTPELSVREVEEIEEVTTRAVQKSKEQAFDKMRQHGYLWLFWLLCKNFGVHATHTMKGRGISIASPEAMDTVPDKYRTGTESGARQPIYYSGDREVLVADDQWERRGVVKFRPGGTDWESDRFTPRSPYDRDMDRLMDEFLSGSLTRVEYDTEMILALANKLHPDMDDRDEYSRDLKQEVEWAMSARSLGAITSRECDRRVSLALRSYVGGSS